MRGILPATLAVLALAPAPGASAQAPVFGEPQVIAPAAGVPDLSMGPLGDARVAWGDKSGVWAALRAGPALPFGAPQRVSAAAPFEVSLARNYYGGAALAYATEQAGPQVALAAPLAAFGAPEDVPLPDRAPPKPENENIVDSRHFGDVEVAVAPDGSAAVVFTDADMKSDTRRAVAVTRTALGAWSAPQILGEDVLNVAVAASATTFVAMWTAHEPGAPRDAPRRVWVADAAGGGVFGAAQAISPAGQDADNNFGGLGLVSSYRGDLLVHYNGGQPGHPIPGGVSVVERPLQGGWGAAVPVSAGMRPSAAVGDRGDAVLIWNDGYGIGASYRSPGGAWGPPERAQMPPGSVEQMPVAIDAIGTVIALRRLDGAGRFVAMLRPPGGRFGEPVDVVAPGTVANWPTIAVDPFGNGVIAWTTADRSGPRDLVVRPYSAGPPAITRPAVRPYELVFSLSEPAQVEAALSRVTSRRGARASARPRKVIVRGVGRPARNRLALPGAARRMLARGGRFRMTIRARDGGPRTGKRVYRFRR